MYLITLNSYYATVLVELTYTYAHNNPIIYNDPDGKAINFITAGIGAISNIAITFVRDYFDDRQINTSWKEYASSAASGAIGGATAGFTMGGSLVVQIAGHAAVGAATSAAASVTEQAITKGEIDWEGVGYSAISGGVSARATKGLNGIWSKVKGSIKSSNTFYQVTSKENATKIISEGKLTGQEVKEVYAWTTQPTLKQVKNSGARYFDKVISFDVNPNTFIRDDTVVKNLRNIAKVSTRPGPISVTNVKEVGFKKEWWQFWKK